MMANAMAARKREPGEIVAVSSITAAYQITRMYLHADMRMKEKALSRTAPLGVKPTRYRPDDKLLAFLESL